MKTIEMSNYSVGESCYNEIPSVCEKYNVKKVVLIGGKRGRCYLCDWWRKSYRYL